MTRLPVVIATLLAASVAGSSDVAAQGSARAVAVPDGWRVRPDAGSMQQNGLLFTGMQPGWHITTGPSVILFNPDVVANGEYRVESEFFLFDPGERREGFGVFIGGRALDGAAQHYTYFLIRRDGSFLIKRRSGERTSVVRDWAEDATIVSWEGRGNAATARNVLTIVVGADDVAFLVNDSEVARLPRADVDTDGVVGLRVNHSVNIHVTNLDITATGSGAAATRRPSVSAPRPVR